MSNDSERQESIRLERLIKELKKKGYTVYRHPSPDHLPEPLKDFRPDAVASLGKENIVFEVKTRESLSNSKYLADLAGRIENVPGWRLELVITNPANKLGDEVSALASLEKVQQRISEAKELLEKGHLEGSFLIAWSALEGMLRLVSAREAESVRRANRLLLIKQLYSLGFFSKHTYSILRASLRIRNAIGHGYSSPTISSEDIAHLNMAFSELLKAYVKDSAEPSE
jgi:hypothetical protein